MCLCCHRRGVVAFHDQFKRGSHLMKIVAKKGVHIHIVTAHTIFIMGGELQVVMNFEVDFETT